MDAIRDSVTTLEAEIRRLEGELDRLRTARATLLGLLGEPVLELTSGRPPVDPDAEFENDSYVDWVEFAAKHIGLHGPTDVRSMARSLGIKHLNLYQRLYNRPKEFIHHGRGVFGLVREGAPPGKPDPQSSGKRPGRPPLTDLSLRIARLIEEHGPLTSRAIAERLDVHRNSVTRFMSQSDYFRKHGPTKIDPWTLTEAGERNLRERTGGGDPGLSSSFLPPSTA